MQGAVTAERIVREELSARYLAAWNGRDPAAIAAFFSAEATYDDRGASELARGREAIEEHVMAVLGSFPDLHFELKRASHGKDFSCGEWEASMTHLGELSGLAPTGRTIRSAGVDVATIDDDGLICHLVSYYDGAQILRDLGLLPARGSGLERAIVTLAAVPSALRRRLPL